MSEVINIKELNERIERESVFVDTLRAEMSKVIVGQTHLIDTLLIGLLSNGHILLEGVPGRAKTLAITTLAKAVDADFARIQSFKQRLDTSYPQLTDFTELSIGMSHDWPLAIRHGATIVRIGTSIFGPRQY